MIPDTPSTFAAARPYRFDRRFDADDETSPPARPTATPALAETAPARFTEDDLANARAQAAAEARAAALREAAEAGANDLAASTARIGDLLDAHRQDCRRALDTAARDAITVALAVMRKLSPETWRRGAVCEIEGLMAQVLPPLPERPELVLAVHPSLVDALSDRVAMIVAAQTSAGTIAVRGDPSLVPGDAVLRWPAGEAVRSFDALWARLESVLARTIDALTPPPPATAADADATVHTPIPLLDADGDRDGRD